MPQDIDKAVSNAKKALAHTKQVFPGGGPSKPLPTTGAPASKPASAAPTTADELKVKQDNINQYAASTPRMHNGGDATKEMTVTLQKGEKVLPASWGTDKSASRDSRGNNVRVHDPHDKAPDYVERHSPLDLKKRELALQRAERDSGESKMNTDKQKDLRKENIPL